MTHSAVIGIAVVMWVSVAIYWYKLSAKVEKLERELGENHDA